MKKKPVKNVGPLKSRSNKDGVFGGPNPALFAGNALAAANATFVQPRPKGTGHGTPVKKPLVIAVVGETATGKSDLAVLLAKKLGGEVISADSRQVYKKLNLLSGKITKREMRGIPHHLLSIADLRRSYSAARYKRDAEQTLRDIVKRGRLPVVAGGTGLYVDALLSGNVFPDAKPDAKLRARLARLPAARLYAMLRKIDPRRAQEIDPKNPRRLIRAIEIAQALGSVPHLKKGDSPYQVLWVGLSLPEEKLKRNIEARIKKRLKFGMAAETRKILRSGISRKRLESLGLECSWLPRYVLGEVTGTQLVEGLTRDTLRFAKRQMRWFKRNRDIRWISPSEAHVIVAKAIDSRR